MKRFLSVFVVLSMLLSIIPITTNVVYASEYNGFTYTIENKQVKITKGATNTADIIIPNKIEGYPVTEIGEGAFNNYTNVTSVKIPNTVTAIGYGAFYGCTGLTDITIPGSVVSIDHMAFQHCSNLETVTMLNGVNSIGQQVFLYCQKLKTLTLPVSVKTIEKESFYDCKNLQNVYYSGTSTDFSKIEIGTSNNYLTNANITYNYTYPVVFEISGASGNPGENVVVNVNIPINSQVCSGRFDLVYDNTRLDIISANAGTLISNPTINQNYAANKIRIVFVGITPLTDAGSILSVEFKIKDSATGQADLALENLKVSDVTASLLNSIATNNSIKINEHIHSWGAWSITKKPTQTETGTAERICGNDSSHKDTATLPVLTDTTVWTVGAYVAPTCEDAGSQEYISSTYGNITEIIPATGHAWGAWNITVKPTKTETGTAERICSNDSSHKDTITLPKLTDDSVWTIGAYVAPTCEDTGSQEYISSVYGKVIEIISATGHSWGAWNITNKPTKTETGTAERICGNDSSHKDTVTLPVLTDTTVWTVGAYVAPTCEDAGSQEYISSTYGNIIEIISATGHSWGAWNITNKPTKTETGTAERICGNDSSHKDTVTLPVLTDTTVWTLGAYVAPTCEDAGSQEYISSTYGNITEIIPAKGHAWGTWNITNKPTKTETGTAERICGNDSSHKDTVTLPKLIDDSVWTVGAYVAPTCENTGSQEYISTVYGKVVETISAMGHAWGAWNITNKPTKTETGTAERICGNNSLHKDTVTLPVLTDTAVWTVGAYVAPTCEDTGSQEYISTVYGTVVETIPATGHAWGAWNITAKPTKTETGTAERICGNDSSHKDTVTLPKLTDDSVWTVGAYVAPTCENTGSQEYTSSTYGNIIETIPATGHAWGAWNITDKPTKTEAGVAERICDNDSSHKDTVTLPKLTDDSVWTVGAYVAPTCEDTGSQEYISSVYGKVIEIIPAKGHAWGSWNITTKPTKTETGTAERICGNDNSHKDTVTLPKLIDDSVWTIGTYIAPTCTADGSQEYISSVYGTVTETIPATGHAWGAWNITKKPTQTETGTAKRICGNDSSHKDTATLPVLTDTIAWTIGAYVAPTCENTGSQEYISSVYGTVTETIPATGHAWGAWNITKKPTQTETGTAERICGNDSSHKETATLPKLTDSSVWTIGAYVAPSCEGAGSQEYTSVYGTVTETIPATGHAWGAWSITTKPTQTETGTAERICNNDSSHKDTATLPVLTDASVWTIGTYIAPTCEGTGSQEYTSIYGKVVVTIPATEHAWGAWNITVNPTKTETGTAERICGNDSSHKETATLPKLTDSSVWTIGVYVAPTCEGMGSQEYTSAYGTVTETIPATGHAWGAWSITKKPTQAETGTAERICGNDSSHKETATLPKLTDSSVWTIGTYVAPTCENTGSQEYISSVYGTVTEIIPATGHSWGAWNITAKPTKTETGKAERICGNNSSHKDTATLPVLTDASVWTIGTYIAPTCEGTGSQEYTSAYGTVTETISATGHAWGAWNITKKPTQTETGTAERFCNNDSSHKDTITLPKLTDDSVWTIGAYVAPTCEDTGSQEYTSTVYGTVIETIPATGHAWGAWNITKKPTQTETGTAERICGNDNSHKDTMTLPVLTDTTVWTIGAYVAPTCENTGSQEYTSAYGKVVETIPATGHAWGAWNITKKPTQSETGTAERICGNDSSHKETATLPKLTDSSIWTIGTYVAPTCENTGSQEYISSVYGTVTETIPATGHAWGTWNITKKPTQTETGTAERICGNDSSHKETATLPVLTDTTVWTIGTYVAPTCENTGSQEYISSVYGTVTETIPATGHAWGAWNITKKPTQTETGTAERICGNDNSHKETATLPVLTDTTVWTIGAYIAPSCEDMGSQEYTSAYGTVTETIPATGHAWGTWNITKKPTQMETGTAERICGNDSSHKETATLPKLTDSSVWTMGAYVAPTCEGTGSQEYTSAYGTVTETIPATGHAWGAWNITKKPTQTETGTAERICGNNSSHKDTATLPKLTDSSVWTIGAYVAPTCENTGSQEYTSAYGTVVEIISTLGHSFNILQHDDTKHWYKCERCTAINNEENHKGGQATKTERAVCSVCNTPYGKLLPNYVLPVDLKTTYGKTLSDIILPAGWKWTDSSIIPTVINNGYEAYYTIDNDTDYDWTKENGYDASANQIKLNLTVNVEKAEQDISYAINSINKYTTDSAFTNELIKNIVQGALSFSSSNENVAIVDNNGLVTIKGAGTAVITATVSETENYNSKSTSYTINVKRYSSHSGGGGSSTSYTISFDTNGGTQIDSVRVRRNGLLKEPESPVKAGYMFDGWYSDKELSVKYDFASKVTKSFTLYAKWHEEKSDNNHSGISDWDNPFKDVHKNDWFYDSVKYVYINGMMKGVASDLFAPDGNITRAMFITVLYRIENEPDTECDNSFNDVEANSYYEKAVYWGRKNGIVKGITNTEYAPDLNITREQMAAMIYRYMTYKNMDLSVGENTNILSYADCSNISDYAIPAMQYAIGSGIIKGMTDNTLEPQGISTRAQAATVFMRTFKLLKK